MKYWQLAVCISEEKEIYNQYLQNINILQQGRDDIAEQTVINALSNSKEFFLFYQIII
ncbi:hypothetical protein ACLB9Y_16905 [Chryseobacterium scophthalmum]|uniref:hypothetical protein n=1 Tax=Chryseobacterium scophthalmum TaxID=59733 RepID=UPI00398B75FD